MVVIDTEEHAAGCLGSSSEVDGRFSAPRADLDHCHRLWAPLECSACTQTCLQEGSSFVVRHEALRRACTSHQLIESVTWQNDTSKPCRGCVCHGTITRSRTSRNLPRSRSPKATLTARRSSDCSTVRCPARIGCSRRKEVTFSASA